MLMPACSTASATIRFKKSNCDQKSAEDGAGIVTPERQKEWSRIQDAAALPASLPLT